MQDNTVDALLSELTQERRRLDTLQADYATITRSRFHALRMLWLSLKQFLGFSSPRDRYAVWSPGMAPPQGSLAVVLSPERPSDVEERLIAAWKTSVERFPLSEDPLVTVIIPVYNKIDVTMRCLASIANIWFETLPVQIIVVDDGSTDATAHVLSQLPGLDYARNGRNLGFIRSCNRGAALARGKYICFLNNDTEVTAGWLDYLVTTSEEDPRIGVVGAKLVYPNGRLQEAGGIIWRDATGWNYGREEDPDAPEYNYVRDVDYCSGAALLVRTDLFNQLGGFSAEFIPAYYEDADLCFGARSLGYRVVYQPRSVVIHYEGLTSGTDLTGSGAKRYQEINRPKFRAKWAGALTQHFENNATMVPNAARRPRSGGTVLVVDSYVPFYDKDAGSLRLFTIIKMLRKAHYHVVFLPDNYAGLQPYTAELQALGVEILHHVSGGRSWKESLGTVLPFVDIAWICRPNLYEKYAPFIRRNVTTKILYDTIDLHFIRKRREAELLGSDSTEWKKFERVELAAARDADATIVVSDCERDLLETSYDVPNVAVIPTIHQIEVTEPRSFESSNGLLFIGGYNHTPNVDAVLWFCREVLPRIVNAIPGITVTLLGANPPDSVLALASERIRVPGYVRDVTPYFESARVFVSPIRFGAGLKGKIGQSMGHGLPVVTTSVGAEGFDLTNAINCMIADDADGFAAAVLSLYPDAELWRAVAKGGIDVVRRFAPEAIEPRLLSFLSGMVARAGA